jgi:tetratricopeptide (TPR) repeat protein
VLDPGSQALLHEAKRKGTLLTFDQMHPSIAMLPSEEQAILAFAEVATFMDAYVARHGHAALRRALDAIDGGADARVALAEAAKPSFGALERAWRYALPFAAVKDARTLKRRFRVGSSPADETADVEETAARKHMRIGDMLWDRGRAKAAAVEYRKAHRADPTDPIVAARFGRAALSSGDASGAVSALEPQALLYPGHAPTHAVLGAAYLELGRRSAAASALREAIWINPFDPDPQCGLSRAVDDAKESERARRACALLRGQ